MKRLSIDKQISKIVSKLKEFNEDAKDIISQTTFAVTEETAKVAKQYAPKSAGKLAQSIHTKKESEFLSSVVVGVKYGAFVEFGTGKKTSVPRELKSLASKFKGTSTGTYDEAIASIEDWLIREGGDPKDADFVLFMTILNGTKPQPYLYPAFVQGRRQYLEDLNKDLKYLQNKYG